MTDSHTPAAVGKTMSKEECTRNYNNTEEMLIEKSKGPNKYKVMGAFAGAAIGGYISKNGIYAAIGAAATYMLVDAVQDDLIAKERDHNKTDYNACLRAAASAELPSPQTPAQPKEIKPRDRH